MQKPTRLACFPFLLIETPPGSSDATDVLNSLLPGVEQLEQYMHEWLCCVGEDVEGNLSKVRRLRDLAERGGSRQEILDGLGDVLTGTQQLKAAVTGYEQAVGRAAA